VERERARIARDIHDDLGASLTHITLLSQSARGELEEGHTAAGDMDQIYTTARELTRAMDEIVWAVNPKHDTLESLMAYLARFAQNFLTGTGLRCRLDVPVQLPPWTLTSEIRHNVFLASKEALNNAVKHAHATEVRLSLELNPSAFVIVVGDNGQGFELQKLNGHPSGGTDDLRASGGNGLQNMKRRLSEVGGRCEWETVLHEGTRVRMTIQINGVVASSKDTTGVILHKER
jgi:signal transduction histidine kinase